MEQRRFKAKHELMTFAARHPGALTGHFLAMVREKLGRGSVTNTRQLRDTPVGVWVTSHGGVKEVRDQREMQTIAAVMDSINRQDVAEALDLLTQRLLAVQAAKREGGGSWAKAEALELIPGAAGSTGAGSVLRLAM